MVKRFGKVSKYRYSSGRLIGYALFQTNSFRNLWSVLLDPIKRWAEVVRTQHETFPANKYNLCQILNVVHVVSHGLVMGDNIEWLRSKLASQSLVSTL